MTAPLAKETFCAVAFIWRAGCETVLRAGEFHIAPSGIGHPDTTSHGGGLTFIPGALAA